MHFHLFVLIVLDEHAINTFYAHVLRGLSLLEQGSTNLKQASHSPMLSRNVRESFAKKWRVNGGFLGPKRNNKRVTINPGIVHRKCELYNVQCKEAHECIPMTSCA